MYAKKIPKCPVANIYTGRLKGARGKLELNFTAALLIYPTIEHAASWGALSAIKNSEELGAYYKRKVEEGKPKMVVLNAVRNKLVLRMWACIREDRMYEKTYTKKLDHRIQSF